jgi:RNA polymerase sigma factor (sigma-70 family)
VQATFSAAYRALRTQQRPVALRPWLFTIARNDCLSIIRKRRPEVELNGEPALRGDPYRELEVREELRETVKGMLELPEPQRAALVLAEMHGLSQSQIGSVLGVRPDQVKAYIYQARSHLISDRHAREADCSEIREELASARGAALLRGRLRRHVRSCSGCRAYADGVAHQRGQLNCLLPLTPSLLFKYRALEQVLAMPPAAAPLGRAGGAIFGGSLAGTAVEVAGGKGIALKVAAGIACLCASAGVGATVLATSEESEGHKAPSAASTGLKSIGTLIASAKQPAAGSVAAFTQGPVSAPELQRLRRLGQRVIESEGLVLGPPPRGAPSPGNVALVNASSGYYATALEAAARSTHPRPGPAERQLEREQNQRQGTQQHERKSAERRQREEAAHTAAGLAEKLAQARHAEAQAEREVRAREREERPAGGLAGYTKGREERRRERKEGLRIRARRPKPAGS